MKLTPKAMGQRGGRARAAKMTPEQRSAAAKLAARARWNRKETKP